MKPVNDKIIVRVDMNQKEAMTVGGVTVRCANSWNHNYREKSPVVACVVEGNEWVKENDILLCHHNLFYHPSPYYLYDDLFSIPASNVLFAIVTPEGKLKPIYGNIICERVEIPTPLPLPPEQRKTYINRAKVIEPGYTHYNKGELIFHRPNAGYDIVYIWNGIETVVTKVHESQVAGVVRN
jgi:hypothetical protein